MNLPWGLSRCQLKRTTWSLEEVCLQQSKFISNSLDSATKSTYNSGLQSYLTFCNIHKLDPDPTADMLSLFVAYMAKQNGPSGKLISTRTITSYLSGVAHLLEPYFPNVREARKNLLVVKTLHYEELGRWSANLWLGSYQ